MARPPLSADDLAQAAVRLLPKPRLLTLWALSWRWRRVVVYRPVQPANRRLLAAWRRGGEVLARLGGLVLWEATEGCVAPFNAADGVLSLCWASALETAIGAAYSPAQQARARQLQGLWQSQQLSRYNHARAYALPLPPHYVVVVDAGDAAGSARMLAAALAEYPDAQVLVLPCPDVPGQRRTLADAARVQALAADVHPAAVLAGAQAVYCQASSLGWEGLLWGKRVRTFAMPYYAGWGLTDDGVPPPLGRQPVPLANLLYAVLVACAAYVDPETAQRCEPERLLAWAGWQRVQRGRFPARLYAYGFSDYKKPIVRRFFQGSAVLFDVAQPPEQATLVVWGRQALTVLPENAKQWHTIRLEDGFIRSVGLGADLIRPLSWALDSTGIYYDATRPSDLEAYLQNYPFDTALLARARQLRERLAAARLTKYNVGTGGWQRPPGSLAGPVILVPGQVESDASLAYGALGLRTNLGLLMAVRSAEPTAYIIYKPHPDVVAGLRQAGQDEAQTHLWCDEIVVDVAMGQLLEQVDEVHTLTSLTGFEALLRGKRVVCYGLPFYAGWGLTEDKLVADRRSRRLSVDELAAAALILYPTYISRVSGQFTSPERALDELLAWRGQAAWRLWGRKLLRKALLLELWLKARRQPVPPPG
jgi:capsular polysaccharide export protein